MFRFTKAQRLLTKLSYDRVFSQAQKLTTPEFILLYRENTLGYSRLGLAISKKSIAKAHDRNRMKRLIRESFRQAKLPNVDLILLAKSGAKNVTNTVVLTNLGKLWLKLNAFYVEL